MNSDQMPTQEELSELLKNTIRAVVEFYEKPDLITYNDVSDLLVELDETVYAIFDANLLEEAQSQQPELPPYQFDDLN